jgi:hypothetical protein
MDSAFDRLTLGMVVVGFAAVFGALISLAPMIVLGCVLLAAAFIAASFVVGTVLDTLFL